MIETKYKFWRRYSSGIFAIIVFVLFTWPFYLGNINPFDIEGEPMYWLSNLFTILSILSIQLDALYRTYCEFSGEGIQIKGFGKKFIPKKEIIGIKVDSPFLKIITNKNIIRLRIFHLKNFEEIFKYLDERYQGDVQKKEKQLRERSIIFWGLFTVAFIWGGIFLFQEIKEIEYSDLKYKLPLKKIEVVQIEGTLFDPKIRNHELSTTLIFLKEYPEFRFHYSDSHSLKSEINLAEEKELFSEQKVKIKIRKKHLKNLKAGKELKEIERRLNFYELILEDELLLRKKHIIDAK